MDGVMGMIGNAMGAMGLAAGKLFVQIDTPQIYSGGILAGRVYAQVTRLA